MATIIMKPLQLFVSFSACIIALLSVRSLYNLRIQSVGISIKPQSIPVAVEVTNTDQAAKQLYGANNCSARGDSIDNAAATGGQIRNNRSLLSLTQRMPDLCRCVCNDSASREALRCSAARELSTCMRRFLEMHHDGQGILKLPYSVRGCVAGQFCPVEAMPIGSFPELRRRIPEAQAVSNSTAGAMPPTRNKTGALTVSVVHSYYKDAALLEHFHFPLWSAVAADPELRDAVEFVVVDDASPANQSLREFLFRDGVNIPAVRAQFLEMQTRIGFNIAGCRNTGAVASRGSVLMMLDADVQPSMQLLREVVRSYQSHGALNFDVYKNSQSLYWPPFVYPWGRGPLEDKSIAETWFHVPAEIVILRDLYFELGGWDEDFSGAWGGEDSMFLQCANKFVTQRRWDASTSSVLVLEPRLQGKSNPNVLRPVPVAMDGYHSKYPSPNIAKYKQKVKNRTLCNRQPVLRVPWSVVLIQDLEDAGSHSDFF